MKTYTPRRGSHAARAVEVLRNGPLFRGELAEALGVRLKAIDQVIASALYHGLIVRQRVGNRAQFAVSERVALDIPAISDTPAEEPAGPAFSARLYDDGELEIFGALPVEQDGNEGFRLTAEQVCKLVRLASGCVVPA